MHLIVSYAVLVLYMLFATIKLHEISNDNISFKAEIIFKDKLFVLTHKT